MNDTNTTSFGFREVPREEKQGLVRGVFDRSARRYDLMNDVMSLGIHRVWKDITITRARPKPGERLIDVAGGTGDLARAFIERSKRPGETPATAIVADINEEMLRAGIRRGQADGIEWAVANAECLPFDDKSADCVMIGFGIRNVTDRMQALREMHRVLKPGGRFLCLEFSRPVTRSIANIYDLWSFKAIPELGALIAKDRDSYQYLVESIRRFPHQEAFAAELREAGFGEVKVTNLSGGIAALHTGWRVG
ncbi:class I SAM-dependent methyltransferase [Glycocaulis abyssi]|uniref:Ubiquinone/menaquinone biosynthesis C-methyltransferase UbiE n=1 Tax=Glycocaulis abyssi TaxID=1433403 RepID=A0ABV9ND55_9PROT